MKLDDKTLTETGLAPEGQGRILVIACGALAREILALIEINGWDHIDLQCLPAILHNTPEKITGRVVEAIEKHRAGYDRVFVAYADCGTGGRLQANCEALGVELIEGPHCYSFFEGNQSFAERSEDEITTFYLTDFLARQFDAFVWRPLGLDRHPQLRDTYFGHYEKLVYLAQTDDPAITQKARDAADRLGLTFERRVTGYGDLATVLGTQAKL
ncbi:DUF1638 domain-containing protein [Marimonas arenosa]|uniref:DUF1638 domain-containing protein n=1 Tax=Marimonas arenosa TaxID=1795305 RepID=A0AAE3WB95_9RHOB|nr:DUF1638 domain-containing protein [Marimonas arenosa]MDQ2088453.1 DUF1638 domain-containing protein [Marimonas arenosa]